jgi:hypothetical protein
MGTDEKILKALEALQADVTAMKGDVGKIPAIEAGTTALRTDVETITADVHTLTDGQAHTHTVLKTLATKQDVEVAVDAAKSELKADILMLESKVVKKIQSHERRITNIEEQEGMENREKN